MALLESGLPRDLIGRDRAAVDGRAVALVCRCQAAPGHRTDDAAQCRSSDVLAHGGEVLGGRRAAPWVDARRAAELDPPFAIGLVPVHHPVDDEELTPCVAWATGAVVAHVEVVAVPADDLVRQSRPSWVMQTMALPDCSADAAVSVTAFLMAAVALSTPGVTLDEPTVKNSATAAAAARATPAAVTPTRRRRGCTCLARG